MSSVQNILNMKSEEGYVEDTATSEPSTSYGNDEQTLCVQNFPGVEKEEDIELKCSEDLKQFLEDAKNYEPPSLSYGNDEQTSPQGTGKRKREEEKNIDLLASVYLRTIYPLDSAMVKNVTVGVFQDAANITPAVLINSLCRKIFLTPNSWKELQAMIPTFSSFLLKNESGKKTKTKLRDASIEIDVMKIYGKQYVRLREGSRHDEKVLLTKLDFSFLSALVPPINRYLDQLIHAAPVIEKYLEHCLLDGHASVEHHVDTAIFNRLPQEIEAFRLLQKVALAIEDNQEELDGESRQ